MPKSAKASRKTKTKVDSKYPKRPPNSYSLFQKDFFAGETEGTFADKAKRCSAAWKDISEVDKDEYKKCADAAKNRFELDVDEYTPSKGFNSDGRKGSKGNGKSRKNSKKFRDPNAPKRNISSYLHFQNKKRSEFSSEIEVSTDQLGLATYTSNIWNGMTDYEKQPYQKMAADDKERYERAMKGYKAPVSYNDKGLTSNRGVKVDGKRYILTEEEEKDPNFPKNPKRSFILYSEWIRAKPTKDFSKLTFVEKATKLGEMWGKLGEDGRHIWTGKAEADQKRYHREIRKWLKTNKKI
ncbi:hypothetical protein TrLO_g4638 [Triparma laevis f. longispina]|uniref:HMG box domain-containing protein n=1 Tax=Triparma laevis f. longispina TaxID=1714387 RepID=A0A9W7CP35_9STRA|nr:hypothetical protein TrLO_g4638 [Triparma laevis f. longispina]